MRPATVPVSLTFMARPTSCNRGANGETTLTSSLSSRLRSCTRPPVQENLTNETRNSMQLHQDDNPVNLSTRRGTICCSLVVLVMSIGLALAADKSGVSPNSISLPKGPGSIEGLGESFQPTLNTGTAKYGLGIKLPPGPAGHQPSLALAYEGGGGNGPLGCGWSLSLPHIQRRTDQGIPTYGQSLGVQRSDTFITESREELVPTADGFFFCENESSFMRYRRVGDHWEGTAPDGTRLEFGITTNGRIQGTNTSTLQPSN